MINSLRRRFNNFNRIRRKGLNKLSPPMSMHKEIVHLATKRPVNIDLITTKIIKLRKNNPDYDSSVVDCVDHLLGKDLWNDEARNLLLALLRSLKNSDPEKSITIGESYLSTINDDRITKTMVQMYIKTSDTDKMLQTLDLVADSYWANEKLLKIKSAVNDSNYATEHFESRMGVVPPYETLTPTICIYADVDVNIIDGSSIWLSSVSEAFCHNGFNVHVILKKNIERNVVIKPLLEERNIKLIEPKLFGFKDGNLGPEQAIELIEFLDGYYGGYSRVLLRGFELCKFASASKSLHGRIWAYLTDYYEIKDNTRKIKQGIEEYFHEFIYSFDRFVLQTDSIKREFMNKFNVPENKISLLPPMIPRIEPAIRKKTGKTIHVGYAGKIAPLWGVLELINVGKELREYGYNLKIHIVGDKIHRNTPAYPDFLESTRNVLTNTPYIIWHGGKSREDSINLMKEMDICWAYRSNILEKNTLELSTKLLELMSIGNPIILTENEVHSDLMGSNYPYFVSRESELIEKMKEIISNLDTHSDLMQKIMKTAGEYTIDHAKSTRINPLLIEVKHMHTAVKKKIVINGHDLKFIGEFESHLKKLGHQVRRDVWGWGDPINLQRSNALAEWGEVIFSEWGLANAVWYSENISQDKRHIIRIHLQEINKRARKFPPQINLTNVSKIVFIAEHVRNTAIELFDWPIEKTMTIPNFVDVDKFNMVKTEDAEKTIAIIGIVPQRKRLDRAIDLLIALHERDKRWKLIVKGNLPHNYAFMHAPGRKKELEYYDAEYERIRENQLTDSVIFEGYTPSLPYWYKKVGYILSSSDFESFHYSIAEGVSSGSIPLIWEWEGSVDIYPKQWSKKNTDELLDFVSESESNFNSKEIQNRKFIEENYGMVKILNQLHLETIGDN